jgi:hypothetical protein
VINLIDVNILSASIKNISEFGISIIPTKSNAGDSKEFLLYAETRKTADSWIKVLNNEII